MPPHYKRQDAWLHARQIDPVKRDYRTAEDKRRDKLHRWLRAYMSPLTTVEGDPINRERRSDREPALDWSNSTVRERAVECARLLGAGSPDKLDALEREEFELWFREQWDAYIARKTAENLDRLHRMQEWEARRYGT